MKTCIRSWLAGLLFASSIGTSHVSAQTLLNINFGVGGAPAKHGFAATGLSTNDVWNLYCHYEPKFVPGMALVPDGKMEKLKLADGANSTMSIAVSNAPGVWGNSSGDPMYDAYMFSQNGSNITVVLRGLPPGQYHFYLYGHADADVSGEQNSIFTLKSGTNTFGPLAQTGGSGWKVGNSWVERGQYVVFRDVAVGAEPVVIEAAPGANGIAVLNGLQVISRGTSPPRLLTGPGPAIAPVSTNLLFSDLRYEGKVSDTEARFAVSFTVESLTTNEISAPLFEGDVALVSPELPKGLRIVSRGRQTVLFCSERGVHPVKLELIARISRVEPWNQISFSGPAAGIAAVSANAAAEGVEMQLLSGTQVSGGTGTNSSRLEGFLGADRTLAMRWQSKGAEITRKSLVTVDTTATAQITPTVIKFSTRFQYEILQAPVPRLRIELPAGQALTSIQGEQIRDWQVKPEGGRQMLEIEFIRPVEKSSTLTVFSEQTVETTPMVAQIEVPQPLDVQRESGSLTLAADDTTVEVEGTPGLRQVNAAAGALAAYRFNARPVSLTARLKRIEPVVTAADRATVRLEETRLVVSHALALKVEQAGIYALTLSTQPGFVVAEVKGDGIEDWKSVDGKLELSFSARVLGARNVRVQLEQAYKEFPDRIVVQPLRIAGATNVTTQLGAASSPGSRLKTAQLSGLREVPVSALPERTDELLAFASEQPDWRLELAAEKLAARVVAEVFDLITIGDGLVGGSATIRYGIINQGVQQFRVAVPPHWKNLEFTGPNIRRKEQQTNVWTITLQDKAWGGYTLVITYDYQFDPKGATLDLAGAHALDVERETGSVGLMTAASLKLTPAAPADPLRRVDEAELSESDRALCTRPLLLAYKYTGSDYRQSVDVTRFEEVRVLEAVADRTELTSVLTEEGQLLTQSSFMVKNNEKQFQRFRLPAGSEFWSSYVNGEPAKPERDGDWLLVPLPRDANRDQAFAVDIVYAQKLDLKTSLFPHRVELAAPLTDIPNTYAEWQLFAPPSQRLSRFAGNMTVAAGTTYNFRDAWQQFLGFYGDVIENHFGTVLFVFFGALLAVLVGAGIRKGMQGAVAVLVVFAVVAVLAAMMLPALSKAKARAQRISAINNLKQIGLATKTWALDNGNMMPPNFEVMSNELGSDKVTIDPNTGQRFIYIGTGKTEEHPEAIIAYAPSDVNGRAVLFADGSVQVLNQEKFDQAMQRDAAVPRMIISANVPAATVAPRPTLPDSVHADLAAAPPLQVEKPPVSHDLTFGAAMMGGKGGIGGTTAVGVRPIRIEIPRAGQAFSFTKVLNAGQEPLKISVSMMRLKVYRTLQMVFQVIAFVFGLLLLWALSLSSRRSSFWMAVAAALVLWSVASLLKMWRLLHLGLIVGVPALPLALVVWLVWRARQRRKAALSAEPPPSLPPVLPTAGAGPQAAAGLVLFLAALLGSNGLAAEPAASALPGSVSIVSATYNGTVGEKVAQFDVTIQLSSAGTNQTVPLFGEGVAIESFSSQGEARLVREGATVAVLLPGRSEAVLHLKLAAKLGGDVTRRQLAFGIPAALASRVSLVIDEPEADVDFPSAVTFQRSSAGQQTRVEAVLGPAERLEMNWTPRVKRAAEIAATVFVQNTALVTFGGGVLNTRATLEYQVSQGELRQVRVQIPAEHRVLRVEGESIRVWELKDGALVVDLLKGISPAYRLTVETERLMERLPATVKVEIPHALDVKRETGLLALRGSEELAVTLQPTAELQRVDAEEFYRVAPDKKDGLVGAFRFLKPDFALNVRAEPVQPQVEAVVLNQVHVGAESVRLDAQVDYTIKRAGVFALRLLLPPDYRLDSVSGTNVAQWVERTTNQLRILEITLKQRTGGAYTLRAALTRTYAEAPKTVAILGVHPLDTAKLSGFITVLGESGLGVKTDALDGLTEIPFSAAMVPTGGENTGSQSAGGLAYKFINSSPGEAASWTLSVATETVQPWVRAELASTVTVTEALVSGRTLVKYEVANAPVKEFRLRVPAPFRNVEITGAQIRRRDQTNDEWRVELQGKVQGQYILTVTWELPKSTTNSLVELSGVEALGVERETGFLSLVARPPLQVTERSSTELLTKIDVRELPAWVERADPATVLVYRYLRPGYKLAVEARRYAEAEVLQALVDNARLTTVVADDGQVMTEVSLSIRNNGRQYLEVELPAATTLWSAFVGGDPVRPSKRDGKLLLPLTRDIASDAPLAVELTFIGTDSFPRHRGNLALISPKFDVPMKNARWDFYLPPDYEYSKFTGSMTRTTDTVAPMVQVYSLSEYNEQQRAQTAQQQMEVRYGLEAAKEKLSGGNLREAISSFSRAKARRQQLAEGEADKDLKKVEDDVRKAQSSNLVSAQNNYFVQNAGKLGDEQTLQLAQRAFAPGQQPAIAGRLEISTMNYDLDVAGQQWDKLEKAQQVAVAKVAPLRVNLPTRGIHYSFSQVLQTEVRKPMTVTMLAENTKTPSWTTRIGLGIAGFCVLWVLMAVVNSQRRTNGTATV